MILWMPRRELLFGLIACLMALVPAPAARSHVLPVSGCPNENLLPTAANLALVRQAALCLVNKERALHRSPRLLSSEALANASQRHATDMVVRRYFGHTTKGGSTYFQRLYRSGYRLPGRPYRFGEALGYDYGERAAARQMLLGRVLLSRLHHDYLMGPPFQHIGIGIVAAPAFPQAGFTGATYVFAVGRRR